jgi:hypothetical protein
MTGSLCRESGGRASILAVPAPFVVYWCLWTPPYIRDTEIKFEVDVQSFERQASKSLLVEFDLDN